MRIVGTQAKGIRTPIITQGDNLVKIVTDAIEDGVKYDGVTIGDNDVIAVTEAVLARAQGNYANIDQISKSVKERIISDDVGIVFPITSRNRFSIILKAIAKSYKKVFLQLSYPDDEVGNKIITLNNLEQSGVNPHSTSFNEKEFREVFGFDTIHEFTGIDYIKYYKSLSDNIELVFSNDPSYILNYTKNIVYADVHNRHRTKTILKNSGAKTLIGLEDILKSPVEGSGYNYEYGLLGSNKSSQDTIKLFPRDSNIFVLELQKSLNDRFNKSVHVMVYGDGAFKDPKGGIWELADPVVSPAFTEGLKGTPNEIKLKYLADNQFSHLKGKELDNALKESVRTKEAKLMGKTSSQGTTPRQISDLLGSLSDLISGSGDKGTPVVLIQGYFDNFAD